MTIYDDNATYDNGLHLSFKSLLIKQTGKTYMSSISYMA
jgi:hypothetical protein